jgi:zinc transporter, ZIP family
VKLSSEDSASDDSSDRAPVATDTQTVQNRRARPAAALIPLALTAALIGFFIWLGPAGIFPGDFPPVEELTVGKVTLKPGQIQLVVTNGGPSPVTISQILIDEAYWDYTSSYEGPIERLRSTTLTIPYPWVEGEPVNITLITSTGVTFDHTVEVATETPALDGRFLLTFALLGIYIGLIPVLLGMTWKPFLGGLSDRWLNFFMAFTAGVLIFLGVETLGDALAEANSLPSAMGGVGVVAAGAIGAFAVILVLSRRFRRRPGTDPLVVIAFTVAFGIGIHNLGEGLAVGAAYRLGEIALGTFLVIGFAIHNTTEGLGIVSILGDRKTSLMLLAALGVLAGLPTVAGAWAGAFFFSPTLAAIFLAIATGAIAEVVVDVMRVVKDRSPGGLASAESLTGIAVGLAVMYLTGLLVAA